MADKSWYTKYRPATLSEYAGEEIKKKITSRFNGRVEEYPHTIMIHGTRGCGKTTLARIFSKYYLCEHIKENGEPCEECETCRSIDEILIAGENASVECPGVTEVDATSANGKEDMLSIMEEAAREPIFTKRKILIFDEVHMVSNAGQNSLLKLIEDIPSHLVVIFATTNPEKVLDTIKSRCQLNIEVKRQSIDSMTSRLELIAQKEGLKYSKEAIKAIVKKSDRVPRECINNLETIAKTYNYEVNYNNIVDYFGDISNERYINFFESAKKGVTDIVKFINELESDEININEFVAGLSEFIINAISIKTGIYDDDTNEKYIRSIKKLFEIYEVKQFGELIQIVEQIIHDLNNNYNSSNKIILISNMIRIGKIDKVASVSEELHEESKISLEESSKFSKYSLEDAVNKSISKVKIEDFIEDENEASRVVDEDEESYTISDELIDKLVNRMNECTDGEDKEEETEDILDKLV